MALPLTCQFLLMRQERGGRLQTVHQLKGEENGTNIYSIYEESAKKTKGEEPRRGDKFYNTRRCDNDYITTSVKRNYLRQEKENHY